MGRSGFGTRYDPVLLDKYSTISNQFTTSLLPSFAQEDPYMAHIVFRSLLKENSRKACMTDGGGWCFMGADLGQTCIDGEGPWCFNGADQEQGMIAHMVAAMNANGTH